LSCRRKLASDSKGRSSYETAYLVQLDAPARPTAQGWSFPFRFDIPASMPSAHPFRWSLSFYPVKPLIVVPASIAVTLGPAPAEELRALEAGESPEQKTAIDAVARDLAFAGGLRPDQRAELRALSPENLAMAVKVSALPAKVVKGVFWFFALLFVVPMLLFAIAVIAKIFFTVKG
jgi:hypothetical protein